MATCRSEAGAARRFDKVAVIGNAGGGKSTLARDLAAILGLPLFTLDDIQWGPGWTPVAEEQVLASHEAWLRCPEWLIDGYGAPDLVRARLERADLIVHVAHPFRRHVWWAAKRQIRAYVGPPPPAPEGCDYRGMFCMLLRMMWRIHRQRFMLIRLIECQAARGSAVIHLAGPVAMKRCLDDLREEMPCLSQRP